MSNFKGETKEILTRPENIKSMDLFDYRKHIGTYDDIALGQLNQSGWLITNDNKTETWISQKQYDKIKEWQNWRHQSSF